LKDDFALFLRGINERLYRGGFLGVDCSENRGSGRKQQGYFHGRVLLRRGIGSDLGIGLGDDHRFQTIPDASPRIGDRGNESISFVYIGSHDGVFQSKVAASSSREALAIDQLPMPRRL